MELTAAIEALESIKDKIDLSACEVIIYTATDIELSTEKNQNNQVLYFRKDINGVITFVEEVRARHDGWLALVTCYRQRKAGRRSNAAP